jgi:hypothetical protein
VDADFMMNPGRFGLGITPASLVQSAAPDAQAAPVKLSKQASGMDRRSGVKNGWVM